MPVVGALEGGGGGEEVVVMMVPVWVYFRERGR